MSVGHEPVLVDGARTPVGRYRGALRGRSAIDLGGEAVRGALARCDGLRPRYAVMGNVLQGGSGQNPARQAVVAGGAGRELPAITLNDVCLASISAVAWAASLVSSGRHPAVLVGGFESMSNAPHVARIRGGGPPGDVQLVDMMVSDGLHCALDDVGMGRLSDRENDRLGISRAAQDEIAFASHERAARAAEDGRLRHVVAVDGLATDEGPRSSTGRRWPARTRACISSPLVQRAGCSTDKGCSRETSISGRSTRRSPAWWWPARTTWASTSSGST